MADFNHLTKEQCMEVGLKAGMDLMAELVLDHTVIPESEWAKIRGISHKIKSDPSIVHDFLVQSLSQVGAGTEQLVPPKRKMPFAYREN